MFKKYRALISRFNPAPLNVTNSSRVGCYKLEYEWGFNVSDIECNKEFDMPVDANNHDYYGICQYKECETVVNNFCVFPFKQEMKSAYIMASLIILAIS